MFERFTLTLILILNCFLGSLNSMQQAEEYSIEVKVGQETAPYIDAVGELTIEYFKGWPYFYSGTLENEREYRSPLATEPQCLFILAKQNDQVVGFISGAPLHTQKKFYEPCKDNLIAIGVAPENCFYYAQVIVDKAHQGKHLVTKMFQAADQVVKAWGYTYTSLATEPDNFAPHRKPEGAQITGPIWARFGYQKHSELLIHVAWSTFVDDKGTVENIKNPLIMWTKKF